MDKDYPLAVGKLEIENQMLSDHQWKIVDDNNISISNVKKLVPNFFNKQKYAIHHKNLQLYVRLGLKLKKRTSCFIIWSINMAKTIYRIQMEVENIQIEAEKNNNKYGKAFYKLLNKGLYDETITMTKSVHTRLVNNEKKYLKWPKPS